MYKLTNRNHYYNSNGMNNDPARTKRKGYHREGDRRISERIYSPGYDTSREYNKGDSYYYDNDSDIYENEFVNNEDPDYGSRPERKRRNRRNDRGFLQRIGHDIKEAWDHWRHNDGGMDHHYDERQVGYPRSYGDDNRGFYNRYDLVDERELRRQRTQYYSDNDFDSVYNAEDENSYGGYDRRNSPYDYQDEFDDRLSGYYNSINGHDYDDYGRGRSEYDFDRERKRNLRKRRARYSMDL